MATVAERTKRRRLSQTSSIAPKRPIANGGVKLAVTGKRRLFIAHANIDHSLGWSVESWFEEQEIAIKRKMLRRARLA